MATIDEVKVSEWYQDKIIPFHEVIESIEAVPDVYELKDEQGNVVSTFKYTPFGYVLDKYADMNPEASIRKDVIRGLIPLGTPGPALWKASLHDLRYIYFRRGKLTKANPELKLGIEQLADQITENVPIFGEHFRDVYTDTGKWASMHETFTITKEEWQSFKKWETEQA